MGSAALLSSVSPGSKGMTGLFLNVTQKSFIQSPSKFSYGAYLFEKLSMGCVKDRHVQYISYMSITFHLRCQVNITAKEFDLPGIKLLGPSAVEFMQHAKHEPPKKKTTQ